MKSRYGDRVAQM